MNDELPGDPRFVKAREMSLEAQRPASRRFTDLGELVAAPHLRADSLALVAKAESSGR